MYLLYVTYLLLRSCRRASSPQKKGFHLSALPSSTLQLRLTAAHWLLGASIQQPLTLFISDITSDRRHNWRDAGSIYFKRGDHRSVYTGQVSRFTFKTHCTHLKDKYTAKCFSAASQDLMATVLILPPWQKKKIQTLPRGSAPRRPLPSLVSCHYCPHQDLLLRS